MRSLSSGGAKAPTRWHRPGMTLDGSLASRLAMTALNPIAEM
jgi:hypothetical protein